MKEQSQNKSSSQFLKTDGGKTKSNAIEVPSISLPKGGGALKGIDEKFSVNAVNGTSSFSIPLPFSPARGASPALGIAYSSGAGNGIFTLLYRKGYCTPSKRNYALIIFNSCNSFIKIRVIKNKNHNCTNPCLTAYNAMPTRLLTCSFSNRELR